MDAVTALRLQIEWGVDEAGARLFPSNEFQVYPVIADYLQRHSAPAATFAVLGSEPELFFYAHRRSVTGYIYMYDLVQDQPFRQRMEKEMVSEVEQGRPDYVVFVNVVYSWLPYRPESFQTLKDWIFQYTENHYDPCGVVTFTPNQYFWGPDCFQRVPLGHRFLMIFERKRPLPAPLPPHSAPAAD